MCGPYVLDNGMIRGCVGNPCCLIAWHITQPLAVIRGNDHINYGRCGRHSPEVVRHVLDLQNLTLRERVLIFVEPNFDYAA